MIECPMPVRKGFKQTFELPTRTVVYPGSLYYLHQMNENVLSLPQLKISSRVLPIGVLWDCQQLQLIPKAV